MDDDYLFLIGLSIGLSSTLIILCSYQFVRRYFHLLRISWISRNDHQKIEKSLERIKSQNNWIADQTIKAIDDGQVKILPFRTVHESARRLDKVMKIDLDYDQLCQKLSGFYDHEWQIAAINTDNTDQSIDDTIVHEVQHYYNEISDTEYDTEEDEIQARRAECEYQGKYITRGLMKKIRSVRWLDLSSDESQD